MQDIYVTGIGIMCALGNNYHEYVNNIFHNKDICHHTPIKKRRFQDGPKSIDTYVGSIKDPDIKKNKTDHLLTNNFYYLSHACDEALKNSHTDLRGKKVALCVGTLLGGWRDREKVDTKIYAHTYQDKTDKFKIKHSTFFLLADNLMKRYHLKGVTCYVISTACSASNNAITLGAQLVNDGFDLAVCGGVDELASIAVAGFSSLGAVNFDRSLQAFCRTSNGLSLGAGAGAVVLQAGANAKHPLAKILGGAITSDAYHITSPEPTGRVAQKAIMDALSQSGTDPKSVGYVNAHGTGTAANDWMEINLLSNLFPKSTLVSSTKGFTGHTLGGAGVIETINCISSIRNHKCLGTHIDSDLYPATRKSLPDNFILNCVKPKQIDVAVNLSFAFAGNNSAVVISRPDYPRHSFQNVDLHFDKLYVNDYASTFDSQTLKDHYRDFHFPKVALKGSRYKPPMMMSDVNPRVYMRLDSYSKMVANTMKKIVSRHHFKDMDKVGIIYSTATGPTESINEIHNEIPKLGYKRVSAIRFPFTVLNAAAGSASQLFNITGPVSVFGVNGTGFIDSIFYAKYLYRYQNLDYLFVVSGSQFSKPYLFKAKRCGASDEDHVMDGCCVALLSKKPQANNYQIVDAYQDKFDSEDLNEVSNNLQETLDQFLLKNHIDKQTPLPTVVNLNNDLHDLPYGKALREVLTAHHTANYQLAVKSSDLHFNTDGGGEEAINAFRNAKKYQAKNPYLLDIEFSNSSGYDFMLLKLKP